MATQSPYQLTASFRDKSGFLFIKENKLLRQINKAGVADYDLLVSSGLYDNLTAAGLLVRHQERDLTDGFDDQAEKVIEPELIDFVSYPYEWCFGQLKAAALLTLEIELRALKHHMTLKDASAFNIQFKATKPIFIDTLSFEKYQVGQPWIAYRQFCQHFLAPLALMSETDIGLNSLFRVYLDGVPLYLADKMLPFTAYLKHPSLFFHINLHARLQKKYGSVSPANKVEAVISLEKLQTLLKSMQATINNLSWRPQGTEWAQYYKQTNYSQQAFVEKKELIKKYLTQIKPEPSLVWDLGANNGEFSRIFTQRKIVTVALDVDPAAVEQNFRLSSKNKDSYMLPLVNDLTNPSPSLGWDLTERQSLGQRGQPDLILALALVHHLSLTNNVPFPALAKALAKSSKKLIIEFIPATDSQVKKITQNRRDDLAWYHQDNFEVSFRKYFRIVEKNNLADSQRTLYFMSGHD